MFPKERLFANLLDKQNRQWIYEPKRFDLGKVTYQPDFYLPKEKLYIEVVGSRQAYHANKRKIKKMQRLFPRIHIIIVDWQNNPYPSCIRDSISFRNRNSPKKLKLNLNPYPKITLIGLKCERCGHEWRPRQEEIRICPKCKSPYWNRPKKKKRVSVNRR